MSAAYFNRKPANARSQEEMRELLWGTTPKKVSERQERQVAKQMQEGERVVCEINRYNWTIQHIKGMVEHARLQTTILGHPVEMMVFKESCENGLRPHLDLCLPSGQELHLTLKMLEDLNEVVVEARRLMNGENSNYFKPKTTQR